MTGASEGIGRAFCERLIKDGWHVTGVARGEARLKDITGLTPLPADLSTPDGVAKIAAHLQSSPYQLLINNAGFGVYGPFYRSDLAAQQAMIRLNIDALVALSHAFLQGAKRGDALINVSSVLGLVPMPINGVYSATKAFVTSFSESLWAEQRRRGVYVMGLSPGATATLFHQRAGGDATTAPPKTILQTPEQVVDVAMRALAARSKPTVVSGLRNQMMARLPRLLPRKLVVAMMGRIDRL